MQLPNKIKTLVHFLPNNNNNNVDDDDDNNNSFVGVLSSKRRHNPILDFIRQTFLFITKEQLISAVAEPLPFPGLRIAKKIFQTSLVVLDQPFIGLQLDVSKTFYVYLWLPMLNYCYLWSPMFIYFTYGYLWLLIW